MEIQATNANPLLDLVLAWIVPPVTDIINTRITDTRWRYVASLVVSLGVGLLATLPEILQGRDGQEVLGSIATVFVASQTYYNLIWKQTGVHKTLKDAREV